MSKIELNKSLKNFNTFGIEEQAKKYNAVNTTEELKTILQTQNEVDKLIIGGGSNVLLTKPFEGLCIHIQNKGITVIEEDEETIVVEVGAGEIWHDLVLWAIDKNYGGLENLAFIPGTVGAAPIQNIGAYGVELRDVFISCNAVSIDGKQNRSFSLEEMEFGYRSSVFKTKYKKQFVITEVQFRLTKVNHRFHIAYGAIKDALGNLPITPKNIAEAVIQIRKKKLPNPIEIGNGGSFFKNPIISKSEYAKLVVDYPELPFYEINERQVKIPAAWLIDTLGFKGIREGDAGVHQNQALVLVNYGNATGQELVDLATKIQEKVKKYFSVDLVPEVNIY